MRRLRFAALLFAILAPSAARASVFAVDPATYHADSLWVRAIIDTLCYVHPTHPVDNDPANWRTRFTFRPEAQAEAVPFLLRRLHALGATVTTESFPCTWGGSGVALTTMGVNVVGRFATRVSVGGQDPLIDGRHPVVVIGGHWDSSGLREGGAWTDHWDSLNAPGADDNASGLAAALLVAKGLATAQLPFDILVAFFDAEELPGLQGSKAFVQARRAAGDSVLLYIDLDTIGYNPEYLRTEVLHNGESLWFARLLAAANDASTPRLDEIAILAQPGLANSDHFSFWESGIQAITFAEHFQPELASTHWRGNGVYDTRRDVADSLRYDLITTIGYNVERALRRYDASSTAQLPSYAVSSGDIVPTWQRTTAGAPPQAGQRVTLDLSIHMDGVTPLGSLRWVLRDRQPDGTTRTLATGEGSARYHSLATERVQYAWQTAAADVGAHQITLSVAEARNSQDVEVARATTTVTLHGPGLRVSSITTTPTPARSTAPLELHYYLPETTPVAITLTDVRGHQVARQVIPASFGGSAGTREGDNTARFDLALPSGVYFAHVSARRRDGSDASASGRIVVLR